MRHFPARAISISFRFVDTIFVEESHKAMSASSCGSVVIWSDALASPEQDDDVRPFKPIKKEFIKSLKLSEHSLKVIRSVDGYVMICDAVGQIRFYDKELKILFWCPSHESIDSIITVSFDLKRKSDDHEGADEALPKSYKRVSVRDFFVRKFSVCKRFLTTLNVQLFTHRNQK